MRNVPPDVHREVLRWDISGGTPVPAWYAVWAGWPHAEGSILLGRTERLDRPRYWRVHPATGEFAQVHRGWVNAISWLLEVREGHTRKADRATGTDSGSVRSPQA